MSLVSFLYKLARITNDISTVASGSPERISKRIANKWIGRNVVKRMWLK